MLHSILWNLLLKTIDNKPFWHMMSGVLNLANYPAETCRSDSQMMIAFRFLFAWRGASFSSDIRQPIRPHQQRFGAVMFQKSKFERNGERRYVPAGSVLTAICFSHSTVIRKVQKLHMGKEKISVLENRNHRDFFAPKKKIKIAQEPVGINPACL